MPTGSNKSITVEEVLKKYNIFYLSKSTNTTVNM